MKRKPQVKTEPVIPAELLEQAKRFVASRGGGLIEAYPKDRRAASTGANSLWTGLASTFAKAGFVEVARRLPKRPIMRFEVRSSRRS